MNKMFANKFGKTKEVYIYDMLVNSEEADLHDQHQSQTFEALRKYNMKLNPAKC